MTAFEKLLDALRANGSTVIENGDKAQAQCPAHNDTQPSLSIGPRSDGKGAVIYCHAGCTHIEVLAELKLTQQDLYDDPGMRSNYSGNGTYTYVNGRNVHRKSGKRFHQTGNTKDRSLYRQERIGAATTVYVPEGEKDVLAIESIGGTAVCSAQGAGKAHLADWSPLTNLDIIIIVVDDDAAGTRHAEQVAGLLNGVAATVRKVKAAVGKDAADHIAAGKGLADFVPVTDSAPELDDAHIGPYIADRHLAGGYLFSGAFGWMKYDGRRWAPVEDVAVAEVVRRAVIELYGAEVRGGAAVARLKAISSLFSSSRIRAIMTIARGYLLHAGKEFDAHPDLLNVGNGVIDLRDGTLLPHDPDLLFTKVTATNYIPDATHPDWHTALTAVNADEADWLQIRFGQGLTGHPTSDDILLVFRGAGENGKSTIIDGINGAASAEYAVPLPDRVLLATTGQHPTELMELRGARIAFMEEFPEIGHLNVKRLKALTGTQWISARLCAKDTVKWKGTHSVFVTSNYLPRIDESDHGTWRRLLLVSFPHRYRKPGEPMQTPMDRTGDPGLRDRVRLGDDKQHEAVLAWMVKGAVRWYQNKRQMPEPPSSVRAATDAWRRKSDIMLRFIDEQLVFKGSEHVWSTELYQEFAAWLKANGHMVWSDQSFAARFEQHPDMVANDVKKKMIRLDPLQWPSRPQQSSWMGCPVTPPNRYHAWLGVKFRDPYDPVGNQP